MEKALLERYLAEGLSLAQMGSRVNRHPTTVAYWLKKHGLVAVHHDANAPKGGLSSKTLKDLLAEGHSVESMAAELDRGVSTIQYWLRKRV